MKLVILAKTYPVPQRDPAKVETVCTGALGEDGRFYRLYPVPFRLSPGKSQYSKWEVIEARLAPHPRDARKETRNPLDLVGTQVKITGENERVRRLLPALLDNWDQVLGLQKIHNCSVALCRMSEIKLSFVENESRERHEEVAKAHENMLFESESLKDLKKLHNPRNWIQVVWKDANGKKHRHRLYEWEYYKVLTDYLHMGMSEDEAESAMMDRSLRLRFRVDNHETWGLFSTHSGRPNTWLLGAVFNFSKASIQSAGEPLFAEPRLNPYEW